MSAKNIGYKALEVFMAHPRCKKRAYGQGTTSPPEFLLI